jgi:hypothetical protein
MLMESCFEWNRVLEENKLTFHLNFMYNGYYIDTARTTEKPPLFGEVSVKFCGQRVLCGLCDGSLDP